MGHTHGLSALCRWLFSLALLSLLTGRFPSAEGVDPDPMQLSKSTGDYALIISAANYNYETTAFFVHHFHLLQYQVEVWLHPLSQFTAGGIGSSTIVPLAHTVRYLPPNGAGNSSAPASTAAGSGAFPLPVPREITALVYINMHSFEETKYLCSAPSKLHERLYDQAKSVIMVNHHAKAVSGVYRFCQAPKCTIFHLNTYVNEWALKTILEGRLHDAQTAHALALYELDSVLARRGPADQLPLPITLQLATFSAATKLLVLVATPAEMNTVRLEKVFANLAALRASPAAEHGATGTGGHDVRLFIIVSGTGSGPGIGTSAGAGASAAASLVVPVAVQPFVDILPDLPYPQQLALVRLAHFMIMLENRGVYLAENARAPPGLPLALMLGVPLIMPHYVLSNTPCLRSSVFYNQALRHNYATTMAATLNLSDVDVRNWKRELALCRAVLTKEATAAISGVVTQAVKGLNVMSVEREVDDDDDDGHRKCCRCRRTFVAAQDGARGAAMSAGGRGRSRSGGMAGEGGADEASNGRRSRGRGGWQRIKGPPPA